MAKWKGPPSSAAPWVHRLADWMASEGWSGATELHAQIKRDSNGTPLIKKNTLNRYLRGGADDPGFLVLDAIAFAFGRSADDLEYGFRASKMPFRELPLIPTNKVETIPFMGGKPLAWSGDTVPVSNRVEFSEQSFATESADSGFAPEIRAGDIVFVDPEAAIDPGCVVLAHTRRKGLVVRKYRPQTEDGRQFQLVALNPDYPLITIETPDDGRIIGRVKLSQKRYDNQG